MCYPDCRQPEVWSILSNWRTRDLPVIYRSFDNADNIQLMNGSRIVPGKVRLYIDTSIEDIFEEVFWTDEDNQ